MTNAPNWSRVEFPTRNYHHESEFPLRLQLLRWLGRQTWLPRGQERLLRLVQDPDTCPHYLFEVDFFGQKYLGDLAHYIDWMVFCYGAAPLSELKVLEAMTSQIRTERPGPISFVDVGANAGHHTLFMARTADQVLAFEPFPALLPLIHDKIAINNLTNVRVIPVALGEKDEVQRYYPGEGANSGEGSFVPGGSQAQPIELHIRKGDDVLDEIGFGRVDLMKVDVEGFEPFVFRGLKNRITKDRPVILTELSEKSRDGFGSEEAFRAAFYEGAQFAAVTGRSGRTFRLRPFDYEQSSEALIVPPEMGNFIRAHCR